MYMVGTVRTCCDLAEWHGRRFREAYCTRYFGVRSSPGAFLFCNFDDHETLFRFCQNFRIQSVTRLSFYTLHFAGELPLLHAHLSKPAAL